MSSKHQTQGTQTFFFTNSLLFNVLFDCIVFPLYASKFCLRLFSNFFSVSTHKMYHTYTQTHLFPATYSPVGFPSLPSSHPIPTNSFSINFAILHLSRSVVFLLHFTIGDSKPVDSAKNPGKSGSKPY